MGREGKLKMICWSTLRLNECESRRITRLTTLHDDDADKNKHLFRPSMDLSDDYVVEEHDDNDY